MVAFQTIVSSWKYEISKNANRPLQAWMGHIENHNDGHGRHVNLHIQPEGGGKDYHNYHITYISEPGTTYFAWRFFDYATGKEKTYTYNGRPCGCEGSDALKMPLELAAG